MKVLHLGSNEKQNSEKRFEQDWSKGTRKWIVWKYCYKNVKMLKGNLIIWSKSDGTLTNIEKVKKHYKVNDFKFLNEEVEEFLYMWIQNFVNVRSSS